MLSRFDLINDFACDIFIAYHFKAIEKYYLYLVFEFSYISKIYKNKQVDMIVIFSEMIITPHDIAQVCSISLEAIKIYIYFRPSSLYKEFVRKCSLCCLDAVASK